MWKCCWLAGISIALATVPTQSNAETAPVAKRLPSERLPNAVQLHSNVISGGQPADDAAFAELAKRGVKTIISVDGRTPDVELALKHGLRYVHLPHGYDGIPDQRVGELAKAVRDLPGPIYIHCHHGKHRSPAAASAACVAARLIPPSAGLPILELAGTSPSYLGLYQSVRQVKLIDDEQLDAIEIQFQSIAEIPAMVESMIAIEHTHDHLRMIAQSNWQTPPQHPDLDPAHEALLMQEHYTELLRSPVAQAEGRPYQQLLKDSETAAKSLHDSLVQWEPKSRDASAPSHLNGLFQQLGGNCKACHEQHRDVPFPSGKQLD